MCIISRYFTLFAMKRATLFPLDAFENIETPFYYYDTDLLRRTLAALLSAMPPHSEAHYAVKANDNPRLMKIIAASGMGADCVSGGEIAAAIAAGFAPQEIVFSGVGKSDKEILLALEHGIGCFNVESLPELEVIDTLAARCGKIAPVALRLNPHIDAHTHKYITTGLSENKFGIDITVADDAIARALAMAHVRLRGVHFHIGSQILTLDPFRLLCRRIGEWLQRWQEQGIFMEYINVGGGLGIDYDAPDEHPMPDFAAYFGLFARELALSEGQTLRFEPGRSVVAQCGSLVTRVLYVKQGLDKKFAIVDAGMNDLLRPALYQAHHAIENLTATHDTSDTYDVVGPVCESADVFATGIVLPVVERGSLLAIRSAGAYGETMASRYNSRELPRTYFSDDLLAARPNL